MTDERAAFEAWWTRKNQYNQRAALGLSAWHDDYSHEFSRYKDADVCEQFAAWQAATAAALERTAVIAETYLNAEEGTPEALIRAAKDQP